MRIILYTGKGGVGKTSVSASTALGLAKRGYRTLVMSTDAAHSLADSFDMPLGNEPVEVTKNLWAQEVSVLHEVDRFWITLQEYITTLLSWRGMEDVVAEEMTVLPGAEELAGLVRIVKHYDSGLYDAIVLDAEKMVVKEAQRTYTYLALFGYTTDMVVCNRLFPPSVDGAYFTMWKDIQSRNHKLVEECF